MKPIIAGALALACLAGCTKADTTTTLYDVKRSLLAADNIALAYLAQPPCAGPARADCVDSGIKVRIKLANAKALAAVKAADVSNAAGGSTEVVIAQAAVAGLLAVVPVK